MNTNESKPYSFSPTPTAPRLVVGLDLSKCLILVLMLLAPLETYWYADFYPNKLKKMPFCRQAEQFFR